MGFIRWSKTEEGRDKIDEIKSKIPVFKTLYQRIFLTRLADNMNTMLSSGVPIVTLYRYYCSCCG
jgi:type IV pilus assembly protein PilC